MGKTYTVKQVAEILGYSTNSIYTFLKERRIKGVRVGKGRFRISEEELSRLLKIAKKPLPPSLPATASMPGTQQESHITIATPTVVVSSAQQEPVFVPKQTHTQIKIDVPSLLDWFVGIASILIGVSLFLLNRFSAEYAIGSYTTILSAMRISFIAAGIGILAIDMLGQTKTLFDITFHIIGTL